MKKALLLLASVALLLVGCQKEQFSEKAVDEGTQDVTFTVGVTPTVTRAAADGDGAAANINHWVMQVLDSDGEVYNYQEKDATAGTLTQTFSVPLIKGQTYQVLFWADTKDKYVVTDLRTVKRAEEVALTANCDDLDAFSAVVNDFATTVATSKTITLYRPFAQLNVVFTDLKKLYETMGSDAEYAKFKPVNFVAKAKVPTTFNVLTQEAGAPAATALEMTAATNYKDNYAAHGEKATLYMDYILTSKASKAENVNDVVDIDFSFTSHGVEIKHNFAAIPFKRNYRTNIIGEFMSAGATWNVEVSPNWTGEKDWTYVTEGSVAAAIEALAAGKTAIEITAPADYTTPVAIPAEADGKDISIKVTGVAGKNMTFELGDGAQGPANLYITTDAQDLEIDLPNSHVEVNGGTYQTVEATTSANTLVVGADVTIETLTILAGNVEIYGKVTGLNRANGVKADWYVDSREKLIAGLTKSIAGESVVLTADIDLNHEEWAPVTIGKAITFDGDNHTIKNLKIAGSYSDSHYGLIGYLYSNGVIKNLTIDRAQILLPESKGDNSRGAALVGIARDGDIINCHVKNVTVKAYQKVGGLIGQYSLEASGTSFVKDCSAENVIISENITGDGVWGAGGLIGSLCFNNNGHSINVEGCSVKGISIANSTTEAAPKQTAHAFIGTIREDAEATATLTGNTVEQTAGLYTDMYSSDYFGWATNPESDPSHKCNIIIDGQEWTPNYPVKIVGGKGYATLNEALTAATAGQTVQILKAGDYTVQTLSTKAAVVEATVEGVVFNHTAGYQNWVSAQDGHVKTVKNITWNVGEAKYQYFNNTNLENCTVNGQLCTHGSNKFKDCTFINEEGYNFWIYGNEYTEFDNCTFTCPGKNDGVAGCGSALNCYNEGPQTPTPVLVVKNCTFTAKEASDKYSAIYVKPETAFDIRISNSTCNDKFCTGAISGSKLWNLKSDREGTTVSIDGNMVYPFSMDADGNYSVKNVNGLKMAIKHWNALKAAGEKSLTLADGTYNVSDMAIFQNYADKSLLIKAENEKQAVITPTAGSKQLIFVVAGMSKSYAGHITIDGIKFDMSDASNKNIESDVISISDAVGTNLPADEKALYSGSYHYGHDITVKNCEIIGFGDIENSAPENGSEHCSVARADGSNGNGYNVKVQNCIIDKMGYVLTSKITTLAEVSNCTITNTKCVINNTSDGTEYKVINNSISTYHDYCIRVNFGPLTVSGNTFNCTYSGDATNAGAVVLRGSTGNEATITGNTITKASGTMYDVYCVTSWNVNGVTISAGTGKNL